MGISALTDPVAVLNVLHECDRLGREEFLGGGRIVVAGMSGPAEYGPFDFALARYTHAGRLDASFGVRGNVLTNFGSKSDDRAAGIAIQSNQKIVAAGSVGPDGIGDFALARYTPSGKLDPSFGAGGKVRTDFTAATQMVSPRRQARQRGGARDPARWQARCSWQRRVRRLRRRALPAERPPGHDIRGMAG